MPNAMLYNETARGAAHLTDALEIRSKKGLFLLLAP